MAGIQPCSCPKPGEWVKGKVIGSGSHGTIHLAMNKATGGLFVVKSAHSAAAVQALEDEANILETLDSPYIVRCLGRNVQKGSNDERKLSIFMEYMAGGSLSDVAEKFGGVLDEEVIRLYAREILHGLKFLHLQGIVHSDLKCKNVLLGSSGNVKLADFGCAKRLKDLKSNGDRKLLCSSQTIGGTPLWMAPEVLRKERLDFAADIWSLGCTVIEMATGRPPWGDEAANAMAAVLKIASGNVKPQFPVYFSEIGLDFLAKCLERKPERRWSADKLLNHPFISGNPPSKIACSPSSVFEIGDHEDISDSDESRSPTEDEYLYKNPFSITQYCHERSRTARRLHIESELCSSSEDWITVRSGS